MPVSEAAIRSGVDGAPGAVVSIVTDRAADARRTFPSCSVASAALLCASAAGAVVAMQQLPAVATPEPTATPSLKIVTVLPAAAAPLNVGVVALVILSVL